RLGVTVSRDAVVTATTRVDHARNRYAEAGRMRVERLSRSETSIEKARERVAYAQRLLDMHQTLFQRQLNALQQVIEPEDEEAVGGNRGHAGGSGAAGDGTTSPSGAAAVRDRAEPHRWRRHHAKAQREDRPARQEGRPHRRSPGAEDRHGGDRPPRERDRRRE